MFGNYIAIRIYVIGLVEITLSLVGALMLWRAMLPRELPTPVTLARYAADHVADVADDPAALERELARAQRTATSVEVVDAAGRAIIDDATSTWKECWSVLPEDGASRMTSKSFCFARRRLLADGRVAVVVVRTPAFPPLALVLPAVLGFPLIVIALSSVGLGRYISVPLKRIASVARAFGEGRLEARVKIKRRDELGQVADAFDDMADRIAELLQAERELIANVSHELRSPLARIRVALDLAAEGDLHTAREALVDISGDIGDLERLIADVLTVARLGLNSINGTWTAHAIPPLRWQHVQIGEIIESAVAHFRSTYPERKLVVSSEGTGLINGDPVLLRRLIDNLLENAHKYTEQPEEVVTLQVEIDAGVRVRVVDRGSGISATDLKHVFRPFFRADRSRTRSTGGLGLGLTLVRRIAEAHGGEVRLDSVVGAGTVVTILLPLAAGHPPRPPGGASDEVSEKETNDGAS
jgi:signal transduction histidine kinase